MTDRSTEIVASTCRVIARLGMHDFRVEDVAEEAGVSSALIYYYFGTRDALIRQAFDFAEGRSSAHASVDGISGAESVRRALMDEIDDSAAARENWVIWGETAAAAVFDDDLRTSLAKWAEDWVGSIAELIRAGTGGRIDRCRARRGRGRGVPHLGGRQHGMALAHRRHHAETGPPGHREVDRPRTVDALP